MRPGLAGALALAALGLAAYWDLFGFRVRPRGGVEGLEAWFFSPGADTRWVVIAGTAVLLHSRRLELREALASSAGGFSAALLLLPAALLHLWARYTGVPELLVPSLTLMLLGAGSLLGGTRGRRAVAFPALFLLFAFPLPAIVVNQLVFPVQIATARFTSWLLALLAVPSARFADLIYAEGGTFQVLETCSGLRSAATLTISAAFYVGLIRRGSTRAMVLVAAAPLVGFLANAARSLSLVLSPSSAFALSHYLQGTLIFGSGVVVLAGLDRLLPSGPQQEAFGSGARVARAEGAAPRRNARILRRVALGALLAVLAAAPIWLQPWTPADEERRPALFTLPAEIRGWSAGGLPLDRKFLGTASFSQWVHRRYRRGRARVDLFIGADDRLERSISPLSPKTALLGAGWEIEERASVDLGPERRRVESLVLRSRRRRILSFLWYRGVEDLPTEAVRSLLAFDRSPARRPGRATVVRVSTRISRRLGGRAEAEARLRSFVRVLRDELARLAAPVGAPSGALESASARRLEG